ncbi:uncharacterized protein MELLADRAFT_112439 [Melampsora larici-populina 98AG31]|uniref:Uncharacterized protein n=1 Tax=Melampsora larici-populina (strain 98AG31 / pathotype 3-4-7) TaxID=747676 RepID=F4S6H3_MELLP|nr:uncharacterized protein MELLADRAFT_112439 [Melampsora larici-populina 98AG31]EGF99760.1 hypothetical protein MELLADRAFT_112439 [Melampsora larici-populina 98AG31]
MTTVTSPDVIAQDSILTSKNAKDNRVKLGSGIMNISNIQILYIHGILARKHTNSVSWMLLAHNHYVHFRKAEEFARETAEAGWLASQTEKETAQRRRQCVEPSRKKRISINQVAFLPDARESFSVHLDKKKPEAQFAAKCYNIIKEPYGLSEDEGDIADDERNFPQDRAFDLGKAMDVDLDSVQNKETDGMSDFYSDGEFGALDDLTE